VARVLLVILAWILGHNILYTYIVPLLAAAGMGADVGQVLMTFGLASLAGIALVGLGVDRHLRGLVLLCLAGFALATLALGHAQGSAWLVHASVALWGMTYGGAPTLLQTACADAAGEGGDVAQSMLVTVWNSAIALGGIIGGLLLTGAGVGSFGVVVLALTGLAWLLVFAGRRADSSLAHADRTLQGVESPSSTQQGPRSAASTGLCPHPPLARHTRRHLCRVLAGHRPGPTPPAPGAATVGGVHPRRPGRACPRAAGR
jgi:MFS family permease